MRASMFVLDVTGNYTVLIKRIKDGREYFVVPGGKIEDGEQVHLAAIREINEELDLKISESDIFGTLSGEDNIFFYAKTRYKTEELNIHGEENERSNRNNIYKPLWISINEVLKMEIFPKFDNALFSQLYKECLNENIGKVCWK